ncbi:hypothetical protein VNI00_018047 [Paramarasmius palmivorus]|uniref:beta-galactosidase n=1 Tax=Paramarasmius palmivorus TaxID=297713 RepID=A0AAW0B210_9AGAR
MTQQYRMERRGMRFWMLMVAVSVVVATISPWSGIISTGSGFSSSPAVFGERVDVLARTDTPDVGDISTSRNLAESFTEQVQFDNYSLIIKGQRVFLHSGEFHTFRLPVPSLWPDILQKFKAAGLNGVSVYVHMGVINPSRGIVDFDGWRALQPLYDAAKEAGIWVVLRPVTIYINAETSAGGLPHWTTTEIAGNLRSNDSDWRAAWQEYIQGIIENTRDNQITAGGPVIGIQIDLNDPPDNEYNQEDGAEYFAELEAAYRDPNSGIVVPLTYNDPGMGRNFINGTGAVDLYGLDSYPQGFDCSHPDVWRPVTLNYHQYHAEVNPSQPWYFPEFQGGTFDNWGRNAPGYERCRELTGADFQSVFDLQLWASNAKLINYYMTYGGTSWGGMPWHCKYPSFYKLYLSFERRHTQITESRMLTTKFSELKAQSIFLRSSPEFYKTDWIGDTSTGLSEGAVISVNGTPPAFVTLLRNPDSGAGFWIVRQNDSTSTEISTFRLNVTTADGTSLEISDLTPITLSGRRSKVIVTDYKFGNNSRALYSTAQAFFAGVIDSRDVLLLHGDSREEHVAAIKFTGTPNPFMTPPPNVMFSTSNTANNETIVSFLEGVQGLITVYDSDTQLILYADSKTVNTFWSPLIAAASTDSDPFANFWSFGTNQSILVGGPYLVRSAAISDGQLDLRGDLNISEGAGGVMLSVIAPKSVNSISWNGQQVSLTTTSSNSTSILTATIPHAVSGEVTGIAIPELGEWKFADSLPEIQSGFDDSSWLVANHTTTNIPPMLYGDGRVLYPCDYGFCENIVLYRGHFNGTTDTKSVNLSINGGEAFAASVWLNDVFVNTTFGNSTIGLPDIIETDQVYTFPEGALLEGEDNVITVIQDNMGFDEAEGKCRPSVPLKLNSNSMKTPRGVRGFKLNDGNITTWKVQGKIGGYTNFPDKTRGVLNEGGTFGERKGWHLPGFDTSSWETRNLSTGLPNGLAGVGFFVTTFDLNIPSGNDVMLSFNFQEEFGQPYRAYLFVNGWMMGKRIGNIGPQAKFPVHQGILDYSGTKYDPVLTLLTADMLTMSLLTHSTVAVALWAELPDVAVTPQLSLTLDGIFEGGVDEVVVNNPSWSPEGRD